MRFALLSTVARVTDATLDRIVSAARIRLPEIAAAWVSVYPELADPISVRVETRVSDLKDGDVPMLGVVDCGDPSAAAFHDVKESMAYGLIQIEDGVSMPEAEDRWNHEMGETLIDPMCDLYAAGLAIEIHDPMQSDSQDVDIGSGAPVRWAPYVTPAFFGLGTLMAGTPTNSLGVALAPGAVRAGGYLIEQNGQEVFGMGFVKKPHQGLYHSRGGKRARRRRARGGR